jgi:hypothetical protein
MSDHLATRPWSREELTGLADTQLIRVAGARHDGGLGPFVTVGPVLLGDEVVIRSLNGTGGAWYRAAIASGRGEVEVARTRVRVAFLPDLGREVEVDRALRARYGNDSGVRRMTSSPAREATLRVLPLA